MKAFDESQEIEKFFEIIGFLDLFENKNKNYEIINSLKSQIIGLTFMIGFLDFVNSIDID
jgi:hypothetical protein